MLKYVNGQYVEMTDEEIESMNEMVDSMVPTIEERIAALEAALLEQILGGTI